ncbi:MAG TPA: nucleotidyltransferase domain-containing protein [Nitrospiraceae bacterium]|nr:nucleotidyltransferase domain-containing protein [Nitrospiraceae bacterium]
MMDYVTAWKDRIRGDEEERVKLFQEAMDAAIHAAQILVDEFGASKVYLFGSLLNIDDFTIHSDVDIAVEGLKVELYFKALNHIWAILPRGVGIDLVPLEDAGESLKAKIFEIGAILYEKRLAYP